MSDIAVELAFRFLFYVAVVRAILCIVPNSLQFFRCLSKWEFAFWMAVGDLLAEIVKLNA